jgi:hypothetical protein
LAPAQASAGHEAQVSPAEPLEVPLPLLLALVVVEPPLDEPVWEPLEPLELPPELPLALLPLELPPPGPPPFPPPGMVQTLERHASPVLQTTLLQHGWPFDPQGGAGVEAQPNSASVPRQTIVLLIRSRMGGPSTAGGAGKCVPP